MTTMELLYFGIFVFVMLLIGVGLTVMEFRSKFGAGDVKFEVQRVDDAEKGRKTQA